jgi:hypothetical protein
MVCGANQHGHACKVIDIKVTNTFPIIALDRKTELIDGDGNVHDLTGYQHFSIPADLEVHLTGDDHNGVKKRLFFEPSFTDHNRNLTAPLQKVFTFVSAPVQYYEKLQGHWFQAQIVLLNPDGVYIPGYTRLFLEFFAHKSMDQKVIEASPVTGLKIHRMQFVMGPFSFASLQRKLKQPAHFVFSYRVGFCEDIPTENCRLVVPRRVRPPR